MSASICLFTSSETWDIESALIRFFTLSYQSHAGWYDASTGLTFSAMADGRGLDWRPVAKRQKLVLFDCEGAAESLAWALPFRGAPYGYWDIAGMICHRNWATPGAFICDLAVFRGQKAVGHPLLNDEYMPDIHFYPADILKSLAVRVRPM
jgi:hypothetical protein